MWQVLIDKTPDGKHSAKVQNFRTKKEADKTAKLLRSQGYKISLWNTRDNCMSSLFRF